MNGAQHGLGLRDAASVKRRAEFQKIRINDHARRNTSEAARKSSKPEVHRVECTREFVYTGTASTALPTWPSVLPTVVLVL
jgi:hypothetical protein